jgi:hypothetical protein
MKNVRAGDFERIDDIPTDVPHESNRQVSIPWEGRTLPMFLVDIRQGFERV